MDVYDLFERGLTEEEFYSAKDKLLDDLLRELAHTPKKPYENYKKRLHLVGKIRKIRPIYYKRYFDNTHIMTPEGIKIKPMET